MFRKLRTYLTSEAGRWWGRWQGAKRDTGAGGRDGICHGLVLVKKIGFVRLRTRQSDVDEYHRETRERRGPLEVAAIFGWWIPSRDASIGVGLFLDCEVFVFVTIFFRDRATLGKERDIL